MIYSVINDNKMLIFNKVEISRMNKILDEKGIRMNIARLVPFDEHLVDIYLESLQTIEL